jgi:small subunit ribosomal protein S17
MFRRKKKEEPSQAPATPEAKEPAAAEEAASGRVEVGADEAPRSTEADEKVNGARAKGSATAARRGNRVQKVGTVSSDKMQKTVVVRVDRQVLHMKYRRYVRRTSKFMAHDDLGATVGDRVRIVETRPLSAKKRWRVVEIVQKAAK